MISQKKTLSAHDRYYGGREGNLRVARYHLRRRCDSAATSLRHRSDVAATNARRISDIAETSPRRR